MGYVESKSLLRMTTSTDQVKLQLNYPWLNLSMIDNFFFHRQIEPSNSTVSGLSEFPQARVVLKTKVGYIPLFPPPGRRISRWAAQWSTCHTRSCRPAPLSAPTRRTGRVPAVPVCPAVSGTGTWSHRTRWCSYTVR